MAQSTCKICGKSCPKSFDSPIPYSSKGSKAMFRSQSASQSEEWVDAVTAFSPVKIHKTKQPTITVDFGNGPQRIKCCIPCEISACETLFGLANWHTTILIAFEVVLPDLQVTHAYSGNFQNETWKHDSPSSDCHRPCFQLRTAENSGWNEEIKAKIEANRSHKSQVQNGASPLCFGPPLWPQLNAAWGSGHSLGVNPSVFKPHPRWAQVFKPAQLQWQDLWFYVLPIWSVEARTHVPRF